MTLIHADGPAPAAMSRRTSGRIARPGQGTGGNAWGRDQSIARFWAHVDTSAGPDGCWLWGGYVDPAGYGRWASPYWGPGNQAHRKAYLMAVGPIPKGQEVDHRCHSEALSPCAGGSACHHRRCVNPSHLRAVAVEVNRGLRRAAERTHCPRNHEFTAENTYINPRGTKVCRECVRAALRKSHAKHRAKRNAERNARRRVASADNTSATSQLVKMTIMGVQGSNHPVDSRDAASYSVAPWGES